MLQCSHPSWSFFQKTHGMVAICVVVARPTKHKPARRNHFPPGVQNGGNSARLCLTPRPECAWLTPRMTSKKTEIRGDHALSTRYRGTSRSFLSFLVPGGCAANRQIARSARRLRSPMRTPHARTMGSSRRRLFLPARSRGGTDPGRGSARGAAPRNQRDGRTDDRNRMGTGSETGADRPDLHENRTARAAVHVRSCEMICDLP